MLPRPSSKRAPWYVIPADHKWYARVAWLRCGQAHGELELHFPEVSDQKKASLQDCARS